MGLLDIILFPFRLVWGLVCFLFGLMGRMISAMVGILFCMLGFLLTATVVGAFAGIPIIFFGLLLIIRAVF